MWMAPCIFRKTGFLAIVVLIPCAGTCVCGVRGRGRVYLCAHPHFLLTSSSSSSAAAVILCFSISLSCFWFLSYGEHWAIRMAMTFFQALHSFSAAR